MSFTIQDLAADAGTLNPVEFRQRHGEGFLLVFSRSDQRTDPRRVSTVLGANTTSSVNVRVHPLKSEFSWIDCGRTPNNDVVVDDATVSKLHAWIRKEGESFVVYDAGSRNGTRVADRAVAVRGAGPGAVLRDNIAVELGSVRARFVFSGTLQDFICTITQQKRPG